MRYILFLVTFMLAFEIRPLTNPIYNQQKAKIGKELFFDKRLSRNKDISCNSCHNVKNYGVDNMRFSIGTGGVKDTPMNTLSVYNVADNVAFFWNGRAESLEEQAKDSFTNPKEHNMTLKEVENIVRSDSHYKKEFKKIYGKNPTIDDIVNAIAEYEKSLVTLNSRFDKFLRGDKNILSEKEKRGYFKFKMYGCITCHNGKNVGGNSFQRIGIFTERLTIPRGLDRYYVTKFKDDIYVYKVPSLRNVDKTYPYFHDGSVKSLKKAIKLMGEFNLGIEIPPSDIDDIEAFLKTLRGEIK